MKPWTSLFALAILAAPVDAFSADLAHRFARDVHVTLRSLLASTSRTRAPVKKRDVGGGVYCVAGRSSQMVFNGAAPPVNPPGSISGSGSTGSSRPGSSSPGSSPSSSQPSSWQVAQHYAGNSFFTGWDFWNQADPTGGTVDYVDQPTAQSAGLVEINNAGNAIMRVDTTPQVSGNRRSVRIQTEYVYTGALIILDAVHMPIGCGTWPAFWSNGPGWPNSGEIDIVEGVNANTQNQATIHTRAGCTIPPTAQGAGELASSTLTGGSNCDVAVSNNAGCGSISDDTNSYGVGFNNAGGGVYAMLWDSTAISVWFFPRSSIPSDITSSAPQPNSWGTPFARWPGTTCDTMSFFGNHSAIFDTTLCGQWAGNVWGEGCAASTGVATCADFVANNGAAFADAYWEVASVTIYQD